MTTDFKNNIFAVSMLFRSLRNGKFLPSNLWEESIVLIEALTFDEATEKAARLGESRTLSYQTSDGDDLLWEFFRVLQVFQIHEGRMADGVELFSRHLRNSEVESLLTPFDDS